MFAGITALLERSLRIDARSWQAHLARVGLMAGIYIALCFVFSMSARFGAPGLRFFRAIVWLNAIFLTLLGVGFFSTAISEEKEEDTLGLMQMAGISPLGILLGKIGGRLAQALLLILVQYPFTLLCVTLGGVSTAQVQAAYVGLMSYMLLLAGFGLLCSTVAPRNRTASALMTLGLLGHLAVAYLCGELLSYTITYGYLSRQSLWFRLTDGIASSCVYLQINTIMASNFGASPWSSQAVSNLSLGAISIVAAWGLFGVSTRNPATEAVSRGVLTRGRGPFRWFTPGRPWVNPFAWKDFHFVSGGVGLVVVRVLLYAGLFVGVWLLSLLWWSNNGRFWQSLIGLYQILLLFVVTIEVALIASRVLHDEVRNQTLAALVMLPESVPFVVYSMFLGAFAAIVPGPLFLIVACLSSYEARDNTGDFLDEAAGWFFLAHFLVVPHLAAVLALSLRWGALPLAIGGGIASVVGWVSFFESVHIGRNGGFVWVGTFFTLAVCIACHFLVVLRVTRLAER